LAGERVSVSIREFARIVGVSHPVVIAAIKAGKRLPTAVINDGGKPKILVYEGCVEWHQNKDHRKDRNLGDPSQTLPTDGQEMETADSNKMQRHYDALLSKVTFLKETGTLTTIDKFKTEAFTVARTVRDSLLYLPNESGAELKKLLSDFLRRRFGEATALDLGGEVDNLALSFRVYQKQSIKKALREICSERFGTAQLTEQPADEVAQPVPS
jgi:hypothetical protein